jgi:hypothetical protein
MSENTAWIPIPKTKWWGWGCWTFSYKRIPVAGLDVEWVGQHQVSTEGWPEVKSQLRTREHLKKYQSQRGWIEKWKPGWRKRSKKWNHKVHFKFRRIWDLNRKSLGVECKRIFFWREHPVSGRGSVVAMCCKSSKFSLSLIMFSKLPRVSWLS